MATPSRTASAGGVAAAHRALAILFAIGALAQFVLAGYAVFGGSSFDAHKTVGDILSALSLIILILAAVGRREALQSSAILFALMILQNILAGVGDDAPALGALHPLNGIAIIGAAFSAAAGTSFGPPHGRSNRSEAGASRTT
jgi:hypothetical protein